MTERLYYDDSYTTDFPARIVERLVVDDRPTVVLDRTYFYPTGGGQPFDVGTIGGVEVVDVFPREEDSVVLHLLAGEVGEDEVTCRVDWERRLDHMQHHTGQHVLSQAFVQVAQANTVGFHLGVESVTIDLDVAAVSPETAEQAEDLANQIVYEDRRVTARSLAPGEEASVRMRNVPDSLATDELRVVEIEDFDATACGGTHVSAAGQIGVIKIIKLEKRGEETRVEFRCGKRALRDYRQKNALVNQLAAEFTVGHWEIDEAVSRLRAELKDTRRELKDARARLLEHEVVRLLDSATERDGVRVVKVAFGEREVGEVRELASRLAGTPNTIALLGIAGQKAHLILARDAALPHDMAAALKRALKVLKTDRGGGRPEFAQGGGVTADVGLVESALDEAETTVSATG
jgi:alanyl-tRNA synthetase